MIALTLSTAAAIALHAAESSWIVFVQVAMPAGLGVGPIKIEGVRGDKLGARLITIAKGCPFDVMLIGMIITNTPSEDAEQLRSDFAQANMHDDWFEPAQYITTYVEQAAQDSLRMLLAQTHPAALDGTDEDRAVAIEEIAQILNVSVPTVRRMVQRGEIPFLRFGRSYRFVPREVLASLSR